MTAPKSRFPLARGLALGALAATALVAACEARVPTAAEVEKMDVTAFEKTAQGVKLTSGPTEYYVDGVKTTPEMARNLAPEKIATVQVMKPALREDATAAQRAAVRDMIWITTTDGASKQPLRVAVADTTGRMLLRKTVPDGANGEASGLPSKVRVSRVAGEPLFYIDGKRSTAAAMNALSPNAIASVEVVKGELATKLYGAEAAKGAIVVKTKQ